MKTKTQVRLESVCRRIEHATSQGDVGYYRRLYWLLCLATTLAEMLRTKIVEQRDLSSTAYKLSSDVSCVESKQYVNRHAGWGSIQGREPQPHSRLSKPEYAADDVRQLRRDIDTYNVEMAIIEEYGRHLRTWVVDLENNLTQCYTRLEVEIVSVLRLITWDDDLWDGCLDRRESFQRMSGAFFHRVDCSMLHRFRPMLRSVKPRKRIVGIGRVSRSLGETCCHSALSYRGYAQITSQSLEARYMTARRVGPAHPQREQLKRRYPRQYESILGRFHTRLPDAKLFRTMPARYAGYARLCRQIAATSDEDNIGSETIVCGRPERTQVSIEVEGASVPLFRVSVLVRDGANWVSTYAYFPARSVASQVQSILKDLTWFHVDAEDYKRKMVVTCDMDAQTAMRGRVTRIIEQRERSYRANASAEERKKLQRKEVARYARELLRAGELSMLDSKNAQNCLPGTLEFCDKIGVPLPGRNWSDTRIDSRQLLRLWRASGWVVDSLFLSAIQVCSKRSNQERREMAPSL